MGSSSSALGGLTFGERWLLRALCPAFCLRCAFFPHAVLFWARPSPSLWEVRSHLTRVHFPHAKHSPGDTFVRLPVLSMTLQGRAFILIYQMRKRKPIKDFFSQEVAERHNLNPNISDSNSALFYKHAADMEMFLNLH